MDQRLLIAEEFQRLVWFVFPSEVLPKIMELKYQGQLTFEALEQFVKSQKKQEDEEWTTPYCPRDYNVEEFKYLFSNEYLEAQPKGEG